MTKPRSLLTAALFALVTANAYVLLTQTASAGSAGAKPSNCNGNAVTMEDKGGVHTYDYDKITADERDLRLFY